MNRFRIVPIVVIASASLAACSTKTAVTGGNGADLHPSSKSTSVKKTHPAGLNLNEAYTTVGSPAWTGTQFVIAENSIEWNKLFAKNGFAEWAVQEEPFVTSAMWKSIAAQQERSIQAGNNSLNVQPESGWVANHTLDIVNILRTTVTGNDRSCNVFVYWNSTYSDRLDITGTIEPLQMTELKEINLHGKWLVSQEYPPAAIPN